MSPASGILTSSGLVLALLVAACGDDGAAPLVPICSSGDCPDVTGSPGGDAGSSRSDAAVTGDPGPPTKAAFGEPCAASADCLTGLCHKGPDGALCTLGCTGTCPEGYICDGPAKVCLPALVCEPDCVAKTCGGDGCGGTCGTCELPALCSADSVCVIPEVGFGEPCTLDAECEGDVCLPPAEGGRCSKPCIQTCPSGWECGDLGGASVCLPTPCVPDCGGKDCGDDGCGGTCGGCKVGTKCDDAIGLCVMLECADLPPWGCCAGDQLRNCIGGEMVIEGCGGKPFCGWNTNFGFYTCLTTGENDPAGLKPKTCGYSAFVGGKDCKEWALCVWGCPVGDAACRGNCDETTRQDELVEATQLLTCNTQQQCDLDETCLKANCNAEYNVCVGL